MNQARMCGIASINYCVIVNMNQAGMCGIASTTSRASLFLLYIGKCEPTGLHIKELCASEEVF